MCGLQHPMPLEVCQNTHCRSHVGESPNDNCRVAWLAKLSMPWVKLVDKVVGEKVGMLVEVELEDGSTASGLFVHKLLSQSVG